MAVLEKSSSFFRAVAPALVQDQDDRMRQIIREELHAHSNTNQPSANQPANQNPVKIKQAFIVAPFSLALMGGFSDELLKIKNAQLTMNSVATKPTIPSQITARATRNSLSTKTPSYSQINPASSPGPAQIAQPTLNPPIVRG